jgi:hypothetical protein
MMSFSMPATFSTVPTATFLGAIAVKVKGIFSKHLTTCLLSGCRCPQQPCLKAKQAVYRGEGEAVDI